MAELKRKFKIAAHQISQLKDEIEAKDLDVTNQMHMNAIKDKTIEVHLAKNNQNEEKLKHLEIQ